MNKQNHKKPKKIIEKLGLLIFIDGGFMYLAIPEDIIGKWMSVIVSTIGLFLYIYPEKFIKKKEK